MTLHGRIIESQTSVQFMAEVTDKPTDPLKSLN